MAGRVPPAHAIVQLWIGTYFLVADDQPRGTIRIFGDQAPDKGQDQIACTRDAKNNLVDWIIELETRFYCLSAEIIEPAKGADH